MRCRGPPELQHGVRYVGEALVVGLHDDCKALGAHVCVFACVCVCLCVFVCLCVVSAFRHRCW